MNWYWIGFGCFVLLAALTAYVGHVMESIRKIVDEEDY